MTAQKTKGYVFQACELSSRRVVALKKSRVSLKVQRTIIHHEARILRLLVGHPSIPVVFAYGRFQHFEYLAMELLGHSLGDVVEKQGRLNLQAILHVADQTVRAACDRRCY
jgi:Serine/threonine protein kinase